MRILISGGSGLLGRKLSLGLSAQGHDIAWLGRKIPGDVPAGVGFFLWNPAAEEMDEAAVNWAEAVINLAGASIGETPWSQSGKKLILESRLSSVATLTKYFSGRNPLLAFTGISGAGFYGSGSKARKEDEPAGSDFPARVAEKWERAYAEFQQQCRPQHFCILRMAVVLSTDGGALDKILTPFRLGFGAVLGSGRQAFNWIHEEDAAGILAASLGWNGIFNASAPARDDNQRLTKEISRVLKKPLILPAVPDFALKLVMGDRASLVLKGNWSDCAKAEAAGYRFKFRELGAALEDLLIG